MNTSRIQIYHKVSKFLPYERPMSLIKVSSKFEDTLSYQDIESSALASSSE